jgi:RsiW-degrading membrane proteinase PrsW (M82 family)
VRTFLLGLLSTVPVIVLAFPLDRFHPRFGGPLQLALYEAFILAAIPEELLKLLVVRGYSARRQSFDEPMDGIVYGATAALGFAALENALYVMDGGWMTALVRAVTAVPMHAAAGAILGYGVARGRFSSSGRAAVLTAWGAAVLVHGLYDFGLLGTAKLAESAEGSAREGLAILGLLLLALGVLIGSISWTLRTVRRLRRDQLATREEEITKP